LLLPFMKTVHFVITKTPPASTLIKKAIKVDKASGIPNRDKVGTIKRSQIKEIAELKMPDLNAAIGKCHAYG